MWTRIAFVRVLFFFSTTLALFAGELSEGLEYSLSKQAAGQHSDVIVSMSEQVALADLDWDLHNQKVSRQARHKTVVLELQDLAENSQGDLQLWLKQLSADPRLESWQSFWITNAIQLVADEQLIREIAARPDVGIIYENPLIENERPIFTPGKPDNGPGSRVLSAGLAAINAPAVWAMGVTGAGALVCNIDTGVDGNHSALTNRWRGNTHPAAECFFDPVNNLSYPYDSGSHGTHTMGTITGMSPVTGDTVGVAFGAQWIAAATIDHPGGGGIEGTISLALQSFQWAVDPDGNPATVDDVPDVISNSWGIPHQYRPECDATFYSAIDACEVAGSVVVFAAGNEGSAGLRSPAARAASIYSTFSVGALDISNPLNPTVAYFSSRGPSACSVDPLLQIKPEISAPGVNVYSSVPGGGYAGNWSGTSMACPHVAGVVALMRSANPQIDVLSIKQIIMDLATDIDAPGDDNNTGNGMIDALACVTASLVGYGSISGVVSANGSPVPAMVQVVGGPQSAVLGSDGAYNFLLPGDSTYTLEYSYFGHMTQSLALSLVGPQALIQDVDLQTAPTIILSGIVTDHLGSPLAGASIRVLDTPLIPGASDANGQYTMQIPAGATYTLRASGGGIGEVTQTLFLDTPTTLDFNLVLDARYQPMNPDTWGYQIFDSNDGAGAPEFNWTSIATSGTPLLLGDDAVLAVALPFNIIYYGNTYSNLTVSSNGFVTPGSGGYLHNVNGVIPGVTQPNRSVYGVWEDLDPAAGGGVYTEYRAGSGEFVIEYSQVPYFASALTVDFQIIVRDPAVYPTISGDAQWLIHYNSDTRGTSTTGMENNTGNDGLLYVYNNTYNVNAYDIEAGLSLLLTTPVGDAGTLSGTMRDAVTSAPLNGVSIQLAGGPGTTTDALGQYSIHAAVGSYTATASLNGYADSSLNVDLLVDQVTPLDMDLLPWGTLEGTISSALNGLPLAGVLVVVDGGQAVWTNAAGYYSFTLPQATYEMTYFLAQHENAAVMVSVPLAQTTTQDISLNAWGTLEGTVTQANGGPALANVLVQGSGVPSQTTNGAGYFSMVAPPGDYLLSFSLNGFISGLDSTAVPVNTTTVLNHELVVWGTLAGTIVSVPGGQPLSGATIAFAHGPTLTSDGSGNYAVTLPPETYQLSISQDQHLSQVVLSDIPGGQLTTRNVQLAAWGSLAGTVSATAGGLLEGVTIEADDGSSALSDASGAYTLTLAPGPHELEFTLFGYSSAQVQTSVPVGIVTPANAQLTLLPLATLSGLVTNIESQPIEGAVVEILDSGYPAVLSGPDGSYSMDILDQTAWVAQASMAGMGSFRASVVMSGNTPQDFVIPEELMQSPSDPDSYGYRIYDSFDGLGAPVFDWQSIAATGTVLNLSNNDYEELATPFNYSFYGTEFATLSVCSNGYLVPGTGYTTSNNASVPTASTPNGAIYGMWDNFNPAVQGTIYTEHSPAHGGFVVEYNNIRFGGAAATVSFQMILLDPAQYTTPTGDAAWLIHYNPGEQEGSTVGIENPTGTDGVEFLFNGSYAPTSMEIDGGAISLLMTTSPLGILGSPDILAPLITHVPLEDAVDPFGPWTVVTQLSDPSGIGSASLEFRIDGGVWTEVSMTPVPAGWTAQIPGALAFGTVVEYHLIATDASPNANSQTSEDFSFMIVDRNPPWCEDFESGDTADFSVTPINSLGNAWTNQQWSGQGAAMAMVASGAGQTDHAILSSPPLNCAAQSTVVLQFWQALRMGYFAGTADVWVRGSDNGGQSFDYLIAEWHSVAGPDTLIQGTASYDISTWAAQNTDVRIQFESFNFNDWYWFVDDFCLLDSAPMLDNPVVSIVFIPVGAQLQLDWTAVAGAASYRVESSADPLGPYVELASIAGTTLSIPQSNGPEFFRVIADTQGAPAAAPTVVSSTPEPKR